MLRVWSGHFTFLKYFLHKLIQIQFKKNIYFFFIHTKQKRENVFDRILITHFKWYIIIRKLFQHIISQSGYNCLPGFTSSTRAVFRLNTEDDIQYIFGKLTLVSDISIGVQTKYLWCVISRKALHSET